nr:PREDICTED: uncharacterized protein LOC109033314 isoform X2 [Bemisia tabaci]
MLDVRGLQILILGLLGCTTAQNNGIFYTGFLADSLRQNNPSRLSTARLLQTLPTTTEYSRLEDQYYQEKPTLHADPIIRLHQNENQESILPRRQQLFQNNNQQVPDLDISIKGDSSTPVQAPASIRIESAPIISHISPEERLRNEKERLEQNRSAKYAFNSVVSDTIFDNSHVREEVRDGLKLAGLYSYSDGFYKRTVHYVADENGYRVIKEDVEPIGAGEGPLLNPNGEIDVASNYDGAAHTYHATAKDIPSLFRKQDSSLTPSKSLTSPALNIRQ